MRVSFDFDSTLDRKLVQDYAKSLINKGYEVWICTSRYDDDSIPVGFWKTKDVNLDLYKVTDSLGIPRERIKFMNMEEKHTFVKDMDFMFHLDDDWIEINWINRYTSTKGISCFGNTMWKAKCNKILGI